MMSLAKGLKVSLLAVIIASGASFAFAADPHFANLNSSIYAEVVKVDNSSARDLIVINKGSAENYKTGSYCNLYRDSQEALALLVVVDSSLDKSVAVSLTDVSVQAGDIVELKLTSK